MTGPGIVEMKAIGDSGRVGPQSFNVRRRHARLLDLSMGSLNALGHHFLQLPKMTIMNAESFEMADSA